MIYDAIGLTINRVDSVQRELNVNFRASKVFFIVIADGSRWCSNQIYYGFEIEEFINYQESNNDWEFIFLGTYIEAKKIAEEVGLSDDRVVSYLSNRNGVKLMSESISNVINRVRNDQEIPTDWSASLIADYNARIDNHIALILRKREDYQMKYPGESISYRPINASSFDGSAKAFITIEEMPRFQGGGLVEFMSWVKVQIKYPKKALRNNISGRVIATFVILKDGRLSDIKVLESPDKLLSQEAIRILRSSPRWMSGKQIGEDVVVKMTVPIDFVLPK